MVFELWHVVLIVASVLNVLVSVFLFKRDDLEPFQKGAQVLIVWLIPFVAAIGLWMFNKSNDVEVTSKKEFGGGPQDSSGAGSSGD